MISRNHIQRTDKNILHHEYKLDYGSACGMSIKSFSDGRLLLQDGLHLWVVAISKQSLFNMTASHTSQYVIFSEQLFNDNSVVYRGSRFCDTRLHIWNPLSDSKGLKILDLPPCENYADNVSDYIVVSDEAELHNPSAYVITRHTYGNLRLWNASTQKEISTLESTSDHINHLTVISGPNFAYENSRGRERSFSCWQLYNQQIKEIAKLEVEISPFAKITWLSSEYFVTASLYYLSLYTKDKLIDAQKLQRGLIDINRVMNSNYLVVNTHGAIQLWLVRPNQHLVLINAVAIPPETPKGCGYTVTVLPNGDVVAALGVISSGFNIRFSTYNYSLHFYRFPELKCVRDNLSYKYVRITHDFSKKLPAEITTDILNYLPEYQFYRTYRSAGIFKVRTSNAGSISPELKVPCPKR